MKNINLLFFFLLITKPVCCQDSILIKKDMEMVGAKIFNLLQKTPRDQVKKMNEETYLLSLYIKDSVIKSIEIFSKPNLVLAASTNYLLQQIVNEVKLVSMREKHLLFLVSIINSSGKKNRPKEYKSSALDFERLYAELKNYGLFSSMKITLSADKGMP
ncbi:MAG: hypothetical protein JNM14_11995 [Ferruginibacter sp.]|nr:hypothetical protein [Ferruginibacter sp.]